MKKLVILFVLPAAIFSGLASCGKKATGPVPTLDVTASYPEKELILQDIATVEYVPLETGDDFLLDSFAPIVYLDENILVTYNRRGGQIFIFDRKTGKGLTSFSRQGRGPGEYMVIRSIAVDAKEGEIFVETINSQSGESPILVYDLQGKYLRTLPYKRNGIMRQFFVYDEDNLFSYLSVGGNSLLFSNDNDIPLPTPYRLLSRTDTVVSYLPIEFPTRENMELVVENENIFLPDGSTTQGTVVYDYPGSVVVKSPEGLILSEPGTDTIYDWNAASGKLTPLVALQPSFASMEIPVVAYATGKSSQYLFFQTYERKRRERGAIPDPPLFAAYDKSDGQFYEYRIVNNDYTDRQYYTLQSSVSLPAGQYVTTIQAMRLVSLYEAGKLQGPLAEVAATLKEDDNPVAMIVTLK